MSLKRTAAAFRRGFRSRVSKSESSNNEDMPNAVDDLLAQPRYTYKPLSAESTNIRVISLLPASDFSAVPEVIIHTITLSDGSDSTKQTYEALSYTWGPPNDPELIVVRGSSSSFNEDRVDQPTDETWTLSVTKNLDEALRYLRLEGTERLLWIDAICINQQDNDEKSHQVGRMAEVYKQAARVVAWVGPEGNLPRIIDSSSPRPSPGSKLAIYLLEEMSRNITFDWSTLKTTPANDDEKHWADMRNLLPYGEQEMRSLHCLLQKSWFERLWIWQEIRLGSASSILVYGSSTISWSSFRRVIALLHFKKNTLRGLEASNFITSVSHVFQLCYYNLDTSHFRQPLERLHIQTEHCKCLDPRDRIFALLGLFNNRDRRLILKPDYSKEPEEIYKVVMLEYIKYYKSLSMVATCRLSSNESKTMSLPTWVPDWSSRKSYIMGLRPGLYSGSCNISCQYRYIEPNQLAVMGVAVGIIDEIKFPDEANVDISGTTISKLIKALAPVELLEATYVTGEPWLDAFTKTLILETRQKRSHEFEFVSVRQYIRDILLAPVVKSPVVSLQDDIRKSVTRRLVRQLKRLRIFTTNEGYMGMVQLEARVGDIIAMVVGFESAMVLRPCGQSYQVVGHCYIHGFMQGQAFLGPMPEFWVQESWLVFINHQTGEKTDEDPRLEGPYPEGWIRSSAEDDYVKPRYKNVLTGKLRGKDPRLTFETLQK